TMTRRVAGYAAVPIPPSVVCPAEAGIRPERERSPTVIGPDWAGDERSGRADIDGPRKVAVVTGSRADFGLLRPVMRAIQNRPDLELLVIAAGSHLISPGLTFYD